MKIDPLYPDKFFFDFSDLLHKPAGKYGRVKANGDSLLYENGIEARFLGVNIVGANCFPDKEKADFMAEQLAQMGCNMVRLHHMDAPWAVPNIFGNAPYTTRVLDSTSLDKLDYLIAQFKKNGIYVFVDLLVHRAFLQEDGISCSVPNGGKQAAFIDQKLISLQKEYITHFFQHLNPYTNIKYVDEPAIIGVCLINEASIVVSEGDGISDYHRQLIEQDFTRQHPNSHLSSYEINYGSTTPGLKMVKQGDDQLSLSYYISREQNYYEDLYEYLKSLGYNGLIGGSNFPHSILTGMTANIGNDMVIANAYWDHPKIHLVQNDWTKIKDAPIDNLSQLRTLNKNLIHRLSKFRIDGKPFLVTEFAQPYPNEYKYEAISIMVLYGLFQGWNAICQFEYSGSITGMHNSTVFDLSAYPDLMAAWAMMAPVFHNQKIKKGELNFCHQIEQEKIYRIPCVDDYLDRYTFLPFITRFTNSTEGANTPIDLSELLQYINRSTGIVSTTTGELSFNTKSHYLQVNSDSVQGLLGRINPGVYNFNDIELSITAPYDGLLMCVSIGVDNIAQSDRILLAIISNTKKENESFDSTRKVTKEAGNFPYSFKLAEGKVTYNRLVKEVYKLPSMKSNDYDTSEISFSNIESMVSLMVLR